MNASPAHFGLSRERQRVVGSFLAAAVILGWLAIHIYGIFVWRPDHGWTVAVVLIIAQAWLSTGLFIIAHDSMHGALLPGQPAWNRRIGSLCLMMYAGLSYRALAPKHASHHRRPGSAEDPDFHAGDPRRPLPWFGRFFVTYYSHGQIARIAVAASVYALVFGVTIGNILLFWAVPAVLALAQLFVFGTYLPHRHEDAPFADEHNARSCRFSPTVSLLTCFHFGGYHHEHHLVPGAPWWYLPAIRSGRREVVSTRS